MLASGGDERIWPDPVTGLNRYGAPVAPAAHQIWFSSSTAAAPTLAGYRAAAEALAALMGRPALPVHQWFEAIRGRILRSFGIPGAEAILTASGTDAELMVLAIARALHGGPLTNLVVAPEETSEGILHVAAGRHSLDSTPHFGVTEAGAPVDPALCRDVEVVKVALRHADGRPRPAEEVDDEVLARCAPLARSLLLHVVDRSKTGLSGPAPALARFIRDSMPDEVVVVVDACQLRCRAEEVRNHLEAGFIVLLTGSKFIGGAPFCGCVLLPPAIADALAEGDRKLVGLPAFCADLDAPPRLRDAFADGFGALANIGLGLRWTTALAELDRYEAIDETLRVAILARFAQEVDARAKTMSWLHRDVPSATADLHCGIVTLRIDNAGRKHAVTLAARLREPRPLVLGDAVCHVGDLASLGGQEALTICASAPLVGGIAGRLASGLTFATAFAPVTRDLDTLFRKCEAIEAATA
jgi:hypothetical protein